MIRIVQILIRYIRERTNLMYKSNCRNIQCQHFILATGLDKDSQHVMFILWMGRVKTKLYHSKVNWNCQVERCDACVCVCVRALGEGSSCLAS